MNAVMKITVGLVFTFAVLGGGFIYQRSELRMEPRDCIDSVSACNALLLKATKLLSSTNHQRELLQTIRILLNDGAFQDIQDDDGWTPLHWAVVNQSGAAVQALLVHGADANLADTLGKTPLHFAAANGNAKIVMLLINFGAVSSIKDVDGVSPLMVAALVKDKNVNNALLQGGIDANTTHLDGSPVVRIPPPLQTISDRLFMAAARGNERAVRLLIEAGADPNEPTKGILPITAAIWAGDVATSNLLIKHTKVRQASEILARTKDSSPRIEKNLDIGMITRWAPVNFVRLLQLSNSPQAKSMYDAPQKSALDFLDPNYALDYDLFKPSNNLYTILSYDNRKHLIYDSDPKGGFDCRIVEMEPGCKWDFITTFCLAVARFSGNSTDYGFKPEPSRKVAYVARGFTRKRARQKALITCMKATNRPCSVTKEFCAGDSLAVLGGNQ